MEAGIDQGDGGNEDKLIKINRIATRTAIRWKRTTKTNTNLTQMHHIGMVDEKPTYTSRLITCTRCGTPRKPSGCSSVTKMATELFIAGHAEHKRSAREAGANARSFGTNATFTA